MTIEIIRGTMHDTIYTIECPTRIYESKVLKFDFYFGLFAFENNIRFTPRLLILRSAWKKNIYYNGRCFNNRHDTNGNYTIIILYLTRSLNTCSNNMSYYITILPPRQQKSIIIIKMHISGSYIVNCGLRCSLHSVHEHFGYAYMICWI